MAKRKEDRIFVKDGRKHYRPRYSLTEVRIGMAILMGLAIIGGWVIYKGAHPDPELFKESPSLVNRAPTSAVDRGPVPAEIAPEGWREGAVSVFGPDNLYEKINGREGYYKSFGFKRLWFVALVSDPQTIDIEVYDLGTASNAIGAFAGEVPEGVSAETVEGGLTAADRNALFVTRGAYYVRAIGADETDKTKSALAEVKKRFMALEGEALPWSFGLFVSLGVGPGKVSYMKENAFSFGFAKDVHVGLLADGETELFLVLAETPEAAKALSGQFVEGFLGYGEKKPGPGGMPWVEDRYLSRVSSATSEGRMVLGVRGAKDPAAGASLIDRMRAAVVKMPEPKEEGAPPPSGGVEEEY